MGWVRGTDKLTKGNAGEKYQCHYRYQFATDVMYLGLQNEMKYSLYNMGLRGGEGRISFGLSQPTGSLLPTDSSFEMTMTTKPT
jgi:hypothetical protein